jgi:hypothetical protein
MTTELPPTNAIREAIELVQLEDIESWQKLANQAPEQLQFLIDDHARVQNLVTVNGAYSDNPEADAYWDSWRECHDNIQRTTG